MATEDLISEETLRGASWPNVLRLARSLGVSAQGKRRAVIRRILAKIYPPVDRKAEVRKSAAGRQEEKP